MLFSFYGATVNVTALPFPPYWDTVEESAPAGTTTKRFTGTDYLMLEAIAEALNFSIQVLSTANWDEVRRSLSVVRAYVLEIGIFTGS